MEAEWMAALPLLRQRVGERNFATWIEPIHCQRDEDGLRLEVTTFAGKQYRLVAGPAPQPGKVLVTADWSPWTYVVNALAFQRAVLPEFSLRVR